MQRKPFTTSLLVLCATIQWASAQVEPSANPISVTQISESFYILTTEEQSGSQHMGVGIGSDGVFVVDSLNKEYEEQALATIRQFSKLPIRYGINMLIHKTGVNGILRTEGASIIRPLDEYPTFVDPNEPTADISYTDKLTLALNDETLYLKRNRNHTLGSSIVHLQSSNVIFTGWAYLSERLPQPRDLYRHVSRLQELLEISDENTVFVPASGRLASRTDLQTYHDTLVQLISHVKKLVNDNRSPEDIFEHNGTQNLAARLSSLWSGENERFREVERNLLRFFITYVTIRLEEEQGLVIDNGLLKKYAGRYLVAEGEQFDIIELDGLLLHGRMTNQYFTVELTPISSTEFFISRTGTRFIFSNIHTNEPPELTLVRNGLETKVTRLP